MKILFLHQNFPGQFKHLAPALAARGHQVSALTSRVDKSMTWNGVQIIAYRWSEPEAQKHHPWLSNLNGGLHRGATVYRAADALLQRGYRPDLLVAHSGWGEALFLRDVWPDAKLGVFSEFHYMAEGADIGFDPEFAPTNAFGESARMRMRNLSMRLQLESADGALTPTKWQASTHPPALRDKITVVHDGIDTKVARSDPAARFAHDGLELSRKDEVITFVNRNLEPYRGFHIFMRALPALLRKRPDARVVIVGGDGISYGTAPKDGGTWKEKLLAEVRPVIPDADWARVHFVGKLPYPQFLNLLRVSTVHLYLTYPFVLSWSLMEAMAIECAIVGSRTAPVEEVITDGDTGLLVDFFDKDAIVSAIDQLCRDPDLRARLGQAARARILAEYDLQTVCLPRQFAWVDALARA